MSSLSIPNDSYYLGVYWGAKEQGVRDCSNRISNLLHEFARIDDRFARWFMVGRSRKDALRKEIPAQDGLIRELLEKSRGRSQIDHPSRHGLGYSLSLWNGDLDDKSFSISIRCGITANNVGNSVVVSLPKRHQGEFSFDFELVRRQILTLIRHFDPEWGVVNSHFAAEKFPPARPNMPRAGWLTYLRGSLAPGILVKDVEFELVGSEGILLIATRQTFCAANERHMASIATVSKFIARTIR